MKAASAAFFFGASQKKTKLLAIADLANASLPETIGDNRS
jgi:hypothetical protein